MRPGSDPGLTTALPGLMQGGRCHVDQFLCHNSDYVLDERCLSVAEDRCNNRPVSAGRRPLCDVLQSIPNKHTVLSGGSTFLA